MINEIKAKVVKLEEGDRDAHVSCLHYITVGFIRLLNLVNGSCMYL